MIFFMEYIDLCRSRSFFIGSRQINRLRPAPAPVHWLGPGTWYRYPTWLIDAPGAGLRLSIWSDPYQVAGAVKPPGSGLNLVKVKICRCKNLFLDLGLNSSNWKFGSCTGFFAVIFLLLSVQYKQLHSTATNPIINTHTHTHPKATITLNATNPMYKRIPVNPVELVAVSFDFWYLPAVPYQSC